MATYEVSIIGLDSTLASIELIGKILTSSKFKKYIGQICLEEVKRITSEKIFSGESPDDSKYMSSHQVKITRDSVIIYNDSMIDVSEKGWMENPYSISLAKIVEYGVGYIGSIYAEGEADNWEYDVNQHGSSGWYYIDSNGNKKWTRGTSGKYIYLSLLKSIEKNASKWISDYIKENYKD